MICITGGERTVGELARRLSDMADYPLQEVRLDLLQEPGEPLFRLLEDTPRLLLTCRSEAEGGGYSGSEEEWADLLRRALACRPDYLDVELSAPETLRRALYRDRGSTRFICSVHRFQTAELDRATGDALAAAPADLLKVAVAVDDAAQLADLLDLLPDEQRPVIRVGMGDAGFLSRALYRRFASPWTYVVQEGSPGVAPGQLTTSQAAELRLDQEGLQPLGLVGGAQVMASPGTPAYNDIFSRRELAYRYLPVVTSRPLETLALLERLAFAGLTVTMPAKEPLLSAAGGWLRPGDAGVGALNTMAFRDGRWLAANTDVDALAALLEPWRGAGALVLGAGGAARAAAIALDRIGCPTWVTSRDVRRSARLARDLGASALPWPERGDQPFHLLINTTPVGSDGVGNPMPENVSLEGKVVVDAVLRPRPTPLVARALDQGAVAFPGAAWWVRQGAAQIPLLTGYPLRREELEEALDRTWRNE